MVCSALLFRYLVVPVGSGGVRCGSVGSGGVRCGPVGSGGVFSQTVLTVHMKL